MKVIITKGTGNRPDYVLEDMEPTMTILDLKKTMEVRQGILHTGQNLFRHFIEVDDEMLLHHYAQGEDTLRLTLILQQRGQWIPETFFLQAHEEDITSFVIIQKKTIKVKAGIFKITQAITKDDKRFCKVYTFKIGSDSLVDFYKKEGTMMHTTNLQYPPKTFVCIDGVELEPFKEEEHPLLAETESLSEKVTFNYRLLTLVSDIHFPIKLPMKNLEDENLKKSEAESMLKPESINLKNPNEMQDRAGRKIMTKGQSLWMKLKWKVIFFLRKIKYYLLCKTIEIKRLMKRTCQNKHICPFQQ